MNDYVFGNFLYTLRTEKKLSQAELGKLLGVTNKAVSKWENGTAKPNTKLIPKIAEIFEVSVEELFACKRFESDSETEEIAKYLLEQKIKFAKSASVFRALILTLPLLLIWFIIVVMGFRIPDEIIGPLGAMVFILAFIISITAFVIYRRNFKNLPLPQNTVYPTEFTKFIKKVSQYIRFSWYVELFLTMLIYTLLLKLAKNSYYANIFTAIGSFVLILTSAVLIYLKSAQLMLKIKTQVKKIAPKHKLLFRELPLWGKICSILDPVFSTLFWAVQIHVLYNENLFFIGFTLLILWGSARIPLLILQLRRK